MKITFLARSVIVAVIVALGTALASSANAATTQFVSVGTGGVAGVYYPTGGAICRLVNRNRKEHGIYCVPEATDGSAYNIDKIRAGELDFGMVQSDVQYNSYNGKKYYEKEGAYKDLRAVFSVYPEPVTVLARPDTGIKALTDVKGRRFNIGNVGSGTRNTWEVLEKALGWSRSDFNPASELESKKMAQALCDNKIDAFFWLVGHPSASTRDAVAACNAKIVDVSGPTVDKLVKEYTFYRYATIPGGMYAGNDKDIRTYGVAATFVTSARVPEEVVYHVVKAVFSNLDDFKKQHPAFKQLKAKEMIEEGLSAPLHPGAIKAYKELGLMK